MYSKRCYKPPNAYNHRLKASGIIPDVLSQFTPKLSIAVSWPASNTSAEIGNTLSPSAVQSKPNISFVAPTAHDISQSNITALKSDVQLTLALTDPDAPSRENPEWSQYLHWLVTGVPLVPLFALSNPALIAEASKNIQELIEWKPPGPPPKTGKHRYVFVALAPANQTTEKLELSVPTERQHWGYGGCKEDRRGLKDWAEENGLVVVGECDSCLRCVFAFICVLDY